MRNNTIDKASDRCTVLDNELKIFPMSNYNKI